MRIRLAIAVLTCLACAMPQSADAVDFAVPPELPAFSQRYDVERDLGRDAQAAFALARSSQRRVLIEVGGDWCHWCHVLERVLQREPALAAQLHQAFVVLKVAVDEDHDGAAALSRFPAADGYPYLYVVDSHGALLHAQDATGFVEAGDYSAPRIGAFVSQWSVAHD